jgi:hypothetical protein
VPVRIVPFFPVPLLLPDGIGSNVVEIRAATRASSRAGRRSWRYPVTSRLRELIQQLGEAIHESVIESEQIAGVVQDIRKFGFDVLLMLEATIGLNEVASKETEDAAPGAETEAVPETPFTQNDLHFLRSLRISVQGEEEHQGEEVKHREDESGGKKKNRTGIDDD